MRILSRLVLREILVALLSFFFVFTALFILVELNDLRGALGLDASSLRLLVRYFLLRVPYLAYFCLPLAMLMASVFVTASHANRSETTAAFAAGISPWRFIRPAFAVGCAGAALLLLGAEWKIPEWSEAADVLKRVEIEKKSPRAGDFLNIVLLNGEQYVLVDKFSPAAGEMWGATFITPDAAHDAAAAIVQIAHLEHRKGSSWEGDTVRVTLPPPQLVELAAASAGFTPLNEKPVEAVRLSTLLAEYRLLDGLAGGAEIAAKLKAEKTRRVVRIHVKLAFPLLLPLLAILGASIGMSLGRQRGLLYALSGALVYTLGYLLLLQATVKFAESAANTPSLQACAGVIPWLLPLSVAGVAFRRLRRF